MQDQAAGGTLPTLTIDAPWNWSTALQGTARADLAAALVQVLPSRRWFGSKARGIHGLEILDAFHLADRFGWLIARVHFTAGTDEVYQIPLAYFDATEPVDPDPRLIRVQSADGAEVGGLHDALRDPEFSSLLLDLFDQPGERHGAGGDLIVERTPKFAAARGDVRQALPPHPVHAEQSNSSVIFGDRLILKIFRRVEMGINPDFELSEFLTRQGFANTPPLAGLLEYRREGDPWGLAMLQAFVPNRGDAWSFTLDWLTSVLPAFRDIAQFEGIPALPEFGLVAASGTPLPSNVLAAFDGFLASAFRLGQRTAEMHLKLAADHTHPDFAPVPFTAEDCRRFYGRASEQARETFVLLRGRTSDMSGDLRDQAERVAALEHVALGRYASLATAPADVDKIRIHGDYHLGQVLATADDFAIIDFEGEPVRSIAERRQKQLALRDVAGMIRSFHYANCTAANTARTITHNPVAVERWTRSWYAWTSVAFLAAYRKTAGAPSFLPSAPEDFERLLSGCLLEKAIYELRYELNNRPDWVYLPLAALEDLLS
jgi:trehalose synthase-fused probable maltokinase